MKKFSEKRRQEIIDEILESIRFGDNDYPVFSNWSELPERYRGWAVEINDHGNITIWNCFKNGNARKIASRV